jgi:hypothetical protein
LSDFPIRHVQLRSLNEEKDHYTLVPIYEWICKFPFMRWKMSYARNFES